MCLRTQPQVCFEDNETKIGREAATNGGGSGGTHRTKEKTNINHQRRVQLSKTSKADIEISLDSVFEVIL